MKLAMFRLKHAVFAMAMLIAIPHSTPGFAESPGPFLKTIWAEARQRGVAKSTFEAAFRDYRYLPEVIQSSKSQPEVKQDVGAYVEKRVAPRVEKGRVKFREHASTLVAIERRYGVPAEVLIAIWGIETNFGRTLGGKNVVHALATLAQRGRRADYFRKELLTALDILQQGHIDAENMTGSWAGAMGQTQFMPSSYVTFAVDFDGDGRKDIWDSLPDAMASTASYLKKNGWRSGETWGYEIRLPGDFDFDGQMSSKSRTIKEWRSLGIARVEGKAFPRPSDKARLYLPMGKNGPAFLLLRNFKVIKRYNNSDSYALAVGHLADRVAGGDPFTRAWPEESSLSGAVPIGLQRRPGDADSDIIDPDAVPRTKTMLALHEAPRGIGIQSDGVSARRMTSPIGLDL